ncbi:hypothetical protein CAPTEDRAFT_91237 [Capitella teleta]|nr:hypothetical protein CAPTEDRAFT_91237 [Capitella teleta]|eukprot:ELU03625.1 hypothetical protein CAPTEDRAFT_91237 [Capitella teleta]
MLNPQAPRATCVLLPVQNSDALQQNSPIRLQALGNALTSTVNNNNNNNSNSNSNNNNNNIGTSNRNLDNKDLTVYTKIQPGTPGVIRCKRKSAKCLPASARKASSVARRNERERNRVKQVNQGFERLREHVPNGSANKKMSKVDTLRSALEYIKYMQDVLEASDPDNEGKMPMPTPPSMQHDECGENSSPNHSSYEDSVSSPGEFCGSTDSQEHSQSTVNEQQSHLMPTSGHDDLLDLASFWYMAS